MECFVCKPLLHYSSLGLVINNVICLSHDNTFLSCASLFLLVSFNEPGIGRRL